MDPVRAQSMLHHEELVKPSRARKVLGVLGSVVGATVVFGVATAAAVVIHLDAPVTRRLVATQVNVILKSTLKGEIHIDHVGHIGFDGLRGVKVRISDPEGIQVLAVDGVDVNVRGLDAARSALLGKGPITVVVPSVRIGNIDANIDGDGKGDKAALRLANTFAVRNPTPSDPNAPPGRGVKVDASSVVLDHAWVHGTPPGAILVDTDVSDLSANAHYDPNLTQVVLKKVAFVTRAMARGVDPRGVLNGTFAMPSGTGQGMDIHAVFDGFVGGMPTSADARMEDKKIVARVDTKDATGAKINALASEVHLKDAFSLHAEAHGDLPHVEAKANIVLGKATVDADAAVDLGDEMHVIAGVVARNVDASAVSAGAPRTNIGLDAKGDVQIKGENYYGAAAVETLPGTVEGQRIPAADIRAKLAGKAIQVRVVVRDGEVPATIAVDLTPRSDGKDGQVISAVVDARVPQLAMLPFVGKQASGAASVKANARLVLPERTLDADATVTGTTLHAAGVTVGAIAVKAKARGSVDRPVVDAQVHAQNVLTGNMPLAFVDASAHVAMADGQITVDDPRVETKRSSDGKNTYGSIKAGAKRVQLVGGNLVVEAAEIEGLGDPVKADIDKHGTTMRAKISAPRIDLPLVVRMAGMQDKLQLTSGTMSLDVDGEVHGGIAKGKIHSEVRDLVVQNVKDGIVDIDAQIDNRKVSLDVKARVGRVGRIALTTDSVEIGGQATDPNAWKKASGKVNLVGEVDLGRVTSMLPQDTLPFADLRGIVALEGRVGRDTGTAPPELQMHAHTLGLVAAGKSKTLPPVNGVRIEATPPWRTSGLDLAVDVRNDAVSGLTSAAFRATDAKGVVVAFDGKTILPYGEIMNNPAIAQKRAMDAPLSGRLIVPPRRLDDFPAIAGLKEVQGAVEANVEISGTALDPRIHADARGRGIQAPGMSLDQKANADLALDYDGKTAFLAVAMRDKTKDLLGVAVQVNARARDFILPSDPTKPADWDANGNVHLASFPLASVPLLAEKRIRGNLTGELALDGLHKEAVLKGKISFADLRIGRAKYTKGEVTVDTSNNKLAAHVRMEQTDGYLDAGVSTGMLWGAEVVPSLDTKQPIQAKLDAKGFRASALQPFIEAQVPSIDGRIDANATAQVTPGVPGAKLEGKVLFHDGVVEVAALGDELKDVKVSVVMTPDGMIKVDELQAHGSQGVLTGDAQVKIDGVRIADATATIRIPQRKAFPINIGGTPLGQVSGTVVAKASQSPDAKSTKVGVEIPDLLVELPQSTKTGVQALGEQKENVRVGVYRGPKNFVSVPLDYADTLPPKKKEDEASTTELGVKIGNITVVRGNSARVSVTGNIDVKMADRSTKVTGKISSTGGWADVQGRKFTVEKADVIFNGADPPNPIINAEAKMVTQDGTQVFADFVGPTTTGKVTLRAEPARTQSEILGLILFGTADGANPSPTKSQATSNGDQATKTAAGLGGGYAAQGLTEGLDQLAGVQASARIDSTESNNPKPEVEFQLSQKVAIAFAHVLGTPPPTDPNTNLVTLDYRFLRNWSLESTLGDKYKVLFDAVWQKSY